MSSSTAVGLPHIAGWGPRCFGGGRHPGFHRAGKRILKQAVERKRNGYGQCHDYPDRRRRSVCGRAGTSHSAPPHAGQVERVASQALAAWRSFAPRLAEAKHGWLGPSPHGGEGLHTLLWERELGSVLSGSLPPDRTQELRRIMRGPYRIWRQQSRNWVNAMDGRD